jgi:hypothetical protein
MSDGRAGEGWLDDAWWAALAIRAVHPIQRHIIEVLASAHKPLLPGDIFDALDERPSWWAFCAHIRLLAEHRAIVLAGAPSADNPLEAPYRLGVLRRGRDG